MFLAADQAPARRDRAGRRWPAPRAETRRCSRLGATCPSSLGRRCRGLEIRSMREASLSPRPPSALRDGILRMMPGAPHHAQLAVAALARLPRARAIGRTRYDTAPFYRIAERA